jgi:hypothetical protein
MRAYWITSLEVETIEEHRGFATTLRLEPFALHHKIDGTNIKPQKIDITYVRRRISETFNNRRTLC